MSELYHHILLGLAAAFAIAVPAMAQDYDPSMAAHEAMSQQQFVTQEKSDQQAIVSEQAWPSDKAAGERLRAEIEFSCRVWRGAS